MRKTGFYVSVRRNKIRGFKFRIVEAVPEADADYEHEYDILRFSVWSILIFRGTIFM